MSKPSDSWEYHPVRYWRQDQPDELQNFGDFLSELFVTRMFILPSVPADAYRLIGSVISEDHIRRDLKQLRVAPEAGNVAFWCCGIRDNKRPSTWALERARFFGVRGPHSRDVLGLPAETVLGDPGLLVPLLYPSSGRRGGTGESICIVHILDERSDSDILSESGVSRVIRASILGNESSVFAFLESIFRADFILSGALHGAIAACAYRIPFAFYNSGYIDVPFKWDDFAASVGISAEFARNLSQGRQIYADTITPNYKPLPLTPILAVAPFAVRHSIILKALHRDQLICTSVLNRLLAALRSKGVDSAGAIAEAQSLWLERAKSKFDARRP